MSAHPPMPPPELGICTKFLNWDHFCTLPVRHKGKHECPCGATWSGKAYLLYANDQPTGTTFTSLAKADAHIEAALEKEGLDWRSGWMYRTRDGRQTMEVRDANGLTMKYKVGSKTVRSVQD